MIENEVLRVQVLEVRDLVPFKFKTPTNSLTPP